MQVSRSPAIGAKTVVPQRLCQACARALPCGAWGFLLASWLLGLRLAWMVLHQGHRCAGSSAWAVVRAGGLVCGSTCCSLLPIGLVLSVCSSCSPGRCRGGERVSVEGQARDARHRSYLQEVGNVTSRAPSLVAPLMRCFLVVFSAVGCPIFYKIFGTLPIGDRNLLNAALDLVHANESEKEALGKVQDCYNEGGLAAKALDLRVMVTSSPRPPAPTAAHLNHHAPTDQAIGAT